MFKPGDIVLISVRHQFKGEKVGFIVKYKGSKLDGYCKDNHPFVWIVDETVNPRYACVDIDRGDTIVKLSKDARY